MRSCLKRILETNRFFAKTDTGKEYVIIQYQGSGSLSLYRRCGRIHHLQVVLVAYNTTSSIHTIKS